MQYLIKRIHSGAALRAMHETFRYSLREACVVGGLCIKISSGLGALFGLVMGGILAVLAEGPAIPWGLLCWIAGAVTGGLLGAILGVLFGVGVGTLMGGIVVAGLGAETLIGQVVPPRKALNAGTPAEVAPADVPQGSGSEASPAG